jgi:N-acetylglucosamine-6-sulfatase
VRESSQLAAIVVVVSVLVAVDPHVPRAGRSAHAATRPSRPDIILIVTDDQRARTFRWMPHVWNEIVRRGRRFSNAMVPTSVCCPSRASLLTGLYAHSTRVWSNVEGWRRFRDAGMQRRTVAVWLRAAGYRTGLVGKYLNHFTAPHKPPGWRRWHSFVGGNGAYYDYQLMSTDGSLRYYGSQPSDYSTNVLGRHAVRFIRSTPADRPLFLYFAPFAPHGPATPAPSDIGRHVPLRPFSRPDFNEADVGDKPSWIRSLPFVSRSAIDVYRANQYRSLQAVDRAVQAMIQVQRERSRLFNTMFIVMSDNGDMWGEHRILGKFVPYDAATRVPLSIRWTKRLGSGGGTDTRLALNLDVPVTIAAAAHATTDPAEGLNLFGDRRRRGFVLEAAVAKVPGDNGTNVARPPYCGWRTMRYLFVRYGNGRQELYDYDRDPFELKDRRGADAYARVKHRLRRRARVACDPPPPGYGWP